MTKIGDSAFIDCIHLKEVVIPNSVTKIGDKAFRRCESLKCINIPDGMTEIGAYAFEGCTSLKNVNIPESVTKIGTYAFKDCWALGEVIISDKALRSIGASAYKEGCLAKAVLADGTTKICGLAFPRPRQRDISTIRRIHDPLQTQKTGRSDPKRRHKDRTVKKQCAHDTSDI